MNKLYQEKLVIVLVQEIHMCIQMWQLIFYFTLNLQLKFIRLLHLNIYKIVVAMNILIKGID